MVLLGGNIQTQQRLEHFSQPRRKPWRGTKANVTDDIADPAPQGTEAHGSEVTCSELQGQACRLSALSWVFLGLRHSPTPLGIGARHLVMATSFIEAAQTYTPTVTGPDGTQMRGIPRPAGKGLATPGADVCVSPSPGCLTLYSPT